MKPIYLTRHNGYVSVEIIPGILTVLATEVAWSALSLEGQRALVVAAYQRLGQRCCRE
jgi:hypothetical protein